MKFLQNFLIMAGLSFVSFGVGYSLNKPVSVNEPVCEFKSAYIVNNANGNYISLTPIMIKFGSEYIEKNSPNLRPDASQLIWRSILNGTDMMVVFQIEN